MAEIRDRVERLCAILGTDSEYLHDAAKEAGGGATLRRIEAVIRDGDGEERLGADLDAFDDAMARTGHGYLTRPERTYSRLPGNRPPAVVDAWVCPAAIPCSRVRTTPDGDGAICSITGQPLKRRRFGP